MSKEEASSWLLRLKKFLQLEPQDKEALIRLLRDAQIRNLIETETLGMIEGVILFSQMKVRDIMIPKKQMIAISQDMSLEKCIDIVTESGHSRFPIISSQAEEVIGILHAKDLLKFQGQKESSFDLIDSARNVAFVPESKRLDSLLSEFRNNRNHMAIVVDEYGTVSGFVTIEDIIEQIIGDIEDEFDIDEEAYIKAHGDDHYIIKAKTPIEEFNEQLHSHFSNESYDTIGGVVVSHFGYLPTPGESVEIEAFKFTILNADGRRIKLVECIDKRPRSKKDGAILHE